MTLDERFRVEKWDNRHFAIFDGQDLVAVTEYKKGANEVKRRLIAYEMLLLAAERRGTNDVETKGLEAEGGASFGFSVYAVLGERHYQPGTPKGPR
jgi:hypothetical protein